MDNMLHKLHSRGFVHGDIRVENMVFTTNTSYLIDFDMVQQEGACYPLGYTYHEDLKHPEAQENRPTRKVHDRFSLAAIMKTVHTRRSDTSSAIIGKVEDEDMQWSLENISSELLNV